MMHDLLQFPWKLYYWNHLVKKGIKFERTKVKIGSLHDIEISEPYKFIGDNFLRVVDCLQRSQPSFAAIKQYFLVGMIF